MPGQHVSRTSSRGVVAGVVTAVAVFLLGVLLARAGRSGAGRRRRLPLFNNHYAAVTMGPEGSAYAAILAGLVRVRDGAS